MKKIERSREREKKIKKVLKTSGETFRSTRKKKEPEYRAY